MVTFANLNVIIDNTKHFVELELINTNKLISTVRILLILRVLIFTMNNMPLLRKIFRRQVTVFDVFFSLKINHI